MFIRSSHPVLDCAMSMVQGATAAATYNTLTGESISLLNAAAGSAVIVSSQKLYEKTLDSWFVPLFSAYIGPSTCGPKIINSSKIILSVGLAAMTTLKIIPMIAGVLSVPSFVLALSATGLFSYLQ